MIDRDLTATFAVTFISDGVIYLDWALVYRKDDEHALLDRPSLGWLHKDYEGVQWIRGHHAQDSKEVAALKVANALGIMS